MTARDLDAAVARLAAKQHSSFSRAQALSAGATGSAIDRRLRAGRWQRDAPGVYGLPGPFTWQRKLMVAHLDLGPDSLVSRGAAAVLHGFPDFRRGSPELLVPAGAGNSPRWRTHECCDIQRGDRTHREGIPATSVVRTFLDLAAVVDDNRLRRLGDDLLVSKRLHFDRLTQRFATYRAMGRDGSARLGRFFDQLDPTYVPSESELEDRFDAITAAAGLPRAVRQHPLPALTITGRVDRAYPSARLLVELDGRRWHERRETMALDRRRDIEAQLRGWDVARFVWGDLLDDADWVTGVVAAFLTRADLAA